MDFWNNWEKGWFSISYEILWSWLKLFIKYFCKISEILAMGTIKFKNGLMMMNKTTKSVQRRSFEDGIGSIWLQFIGWFGVSESRNYSSKCIIWACKAQGIDTMYQDPIQRGKKPFWEFVMKISKRKQYWSSQYLNMRTNYSGNVCRKVSSMSNEIGKILVIEECLTYKLPELIANNFGYFFNKILGLFLYL
mgnify:FL=1